MIALAIRASAASPLDPPSTLETRILGQAEWLAGSRAALRVTVRDAASDRPLEADLTLALHSPKGPPLRLWEGRTHALGSADFSLRVPTVAPGSYRLRVDVASTLGNDRIERDLTLSWGAQAVLRSDRPSYLGGEVVRLRALVLQLPSLRPAARLPVPLEIFDPRANLVFSRAIECSDWGIATLDFRLAGEAIGGPWTVRLRLPRGSTETRFWVTPPEPSELDLELELERSWAVPGERVRGVVRLRGPQREGAGSARVRVEAETAVEGEASAGVEGAIDAAGRFPFALELPPTVLPAAAGMARLAIVAQASDPARRRGRRSAEILVSAQPLRILHAIDHGTQHPLEQRLLRVAIAYPDGTPVAGARVTLGPASARLATTADALGLAEFRIGTRPSDQAIPIEASDQHGRSILLEAVLPAPKPNPGLALALGRALVRVGESLAITVSGAAKGAVWLDLVASGQTVATRSLALNRGSASLALPIGPELVGLVEVRAYQFDPEDRPLGSSARVLVLPAADLTIEMFADRVAYLPGDVARLGLTATDERGVPAISALAIEAWPAGAGEGRPFESVLARLALAVAGELADPPPGSDAAALASLLRAAEGASDPAARERAVRFVLAALPEQDDRQPLLANSRHERLESSKQRWRKTIDGDAVRIQRALDRLRAQGGRSPALLSSETALSTLVRIGRLKPRETMDPWGNRYRVAMDGSRLERLISAGPDASFGNADDVSWPASVPRPPPLGGASLDGSAATPRPHPGPAPVGTGSAPLLWLPELLSDERGHAYVDLPWPASGGAVRVMASASSRPGGFGSGAIELAGAAEPAIRVLAPATLVAGDELVVPVEIESRSETPAVVTVALEGSAARASAQEHRAATVELAPRSLRVHRLRLRADGSGDSTLRVSRAGASALPLLTLPIRVLPAGRQVDESWSGNLHAPLRLAPRDEPRADREISGELRLFAGPGALALNAFATLSRRPVPGPAAAAAELRLAARLAREQATYSHVSLQRLVALEHPERGFAGEQAGRDGTAELALVLLALGSESRAQASGGGVQSRGRTALAARLAADGRLALPVAGPEGDPGHAARDPGSVDARADARLGALTAWALAEAGERGPGLELALERLVKDPVVAGDPWALAASTLALEAHGSPARGAGGLRARLTALAASAGAEAPWPGSERSPTGSRGVAAEIETNALVMLALAPHPAAAAAVARAGSWLVRQLAPDGSFGAPWATALAAEALLATARPEAAPPAPPRIRAAGSELAIEPAIRSRWESRRIALAPGVAAGGIEIDAAPGDWLAQLVRRSDAPQAKGESDAPLSAIDLELGWADTSITAREPLELRLSARSRESRTLRDVVIELSLPPGAVPDRESLQAGVTSGALAAFATAEGQLWLRVARIEPGRGFEVRIWASPGSALVAAARAAYAWEEANPEQQTWAFTESLRIKDGKPGR